VRQQAERSGGVGGWGRRQRLESAAAAEQAQHINSPSHIDCYF
jgi:hypothetical protein